MFIFYTRRLALFYRKLATLVTSGCSIIEAFNIISSQQSPGGLKYACQQIKQDLARGCLLNEAFAKFPEIFPSWQISIIKYSEAAGRLGSGLSGLADYTEKEYSTQLSIISGLAYPVLLLHIAIFLLPVINLISCGPGGYILGVLKLLIPIYGLIGLAYLFSRIFNKLQVKNTFDLVILALPFLGNIVRQIAVARFIRALQCLCASGVAIISGWRIAADACGNSAVKAAVLSGLPLIEQGQGISQAFARSGVFSPDMIGMIQAAEKSGNIVEILGIIANYSEKENETAAAVLSKVVPVIVYLLIAAFIGFKIISFYSCYFNKLFSM